MTVAGSRRGAGLGGREEQNLGAPLEELVGHDRLAVAEDLDRHGLVGQPGWSHGVTADELDPEGLAPALGPDRPRDRWGDLIAHRDGLGRGHGRGELARPTLEEALVRPGRRRDDLAAGGEDA